MGVMNVATYGFTMVAARMLGPRAYGALAGLMATLLVISVLQLGLQATAARRISADPQHVDQIQSIMLRVTYRGALALGLVLLVLSPLLNVALRLDSLPTAALVAVTAVPLTIMGGQAGVLQGERRWTPLALMYIAAGVPRLLIGFALMLWSPTEASAMSGVALGAFVPIGVGFVALRHARPAGESDAKHGAAHVIWESFRNSQALFAFFALSNVDVVVARNVLSDHDAGLYASGLILVKAVLFLPQFVVVVAFPAMSTVSERRHALTRSLILVALLGVVSTAGAWLLPDLALVFVGGAEYGEIAGRLWVFAVVGTLLSMLQLLVYAVLARQGARSVYLVWLSLLVLVGVGFTVSSVTSLLLLVLTLDGALFAVLLAISLYLVADPAQAEKTAASTDQ
jgi:O-antigen/teichoic acid export membrane protein